MTAASTSYLPEMRRRRILVCLDRSTFSEGCVPYAVSLAKTFGSAITLAHIMQPQLQRGGSSTNDALGWEISRQEAQGYLERIEKEVAQALGKPVDVRLEQGQPAERIVDLAREIGADLTVLGSRGKGAAAARSLGSTAQQVLAMAHGSVFIAPSSSTAAAPNPKRILVPLDGSLRTESVLPTAARIANTHGEMLLVHVVQEPLPTAMLHATEDMELARKLAARLEISATKYLKDLQQQLAHEGTSVRTLVVRHANPQQCLLELSEKEHTELVVLTAHGSACDPAQSFGSVTGYLLAHSTVPLLVLQDLAEPTDRTDDVEQRRTPNSLRASYAMESG
jgi:nucleotide-binding universal stress UspA family protein